MATGNANAKVSQCLRRCWLCHPDWLSVSFCRGPGLSRSAQRNKKKREKKAGEGKDGDDQASTAVRALWGPECELDFVSGRFCCN
jgi:hypothetical protein